MKQYTITALVANQSGVLTRISGLFARRGYNIDSLSVCTTENAKFSRMTIVSVCDEATIQQITKQLDKLVDVIKVCLLDSSKSVIRELLLLKISVLPYQRPEIESTASIYKAKLIDLNQESVIVELTGEPSKIDAFISILEPYGIIELIRTGVSALSRGKESINDLIDYNDLV